MIKRVKRVKLSLRPPPIGPLVTARPASKVRTLWCTKRYGCWTLFVNVDKNTSPPKKKQLECHGTWIYIYIYNVGNGLVNPPSTIEGKWINFFNRLWRDSLCAIDSLLLNVLGTMGWILYWQMYCWLAGWLLAACCFCFLFPFPFSFHLR